MSGYATALVLSLVTVGAIVYLLRSRRIREKYAAAWILLALAVVVLGAFPDVLGYLARALGVQTPVNLLFLVSGLILLVVSVQFSVEISQLEEETRTLAEEIALLRRDVEEGLGAWAQQSAGPRGDHAAEPPGQVGPALPDPAVLDQAARDQALLDQSVPEQAVPEQAVPEQADERLPARQQAQQ